MLKKIFLEEFIDREALKSFLGRLRIFSGVEVVLFNDRGEPIFGDPKGFLSDSGLTFQSLQEKSQIILSDRSLLKALPLQFRGWLYGVLLLGPFSPKKNISMAPQTAELPEKCPNATPRISNISDVKLPKDEEDRIQALLEMAEQFFSQQIEISAERETLKRKEKILSVLEEASNIMNSSLEFENLLEFLMDIAIEITGATCGALLLRKDRKRYLDVMVARGKFPQEVKKIRIPFGKGVTGWVASHREPLIVPNVLLEPRYIETPETIYSEMAVPLLVQERLIGVIAVDSSELNAFSKDDCASLSTLASMVAKVLENAKLLANANQKIREISNLFSISEQLAETTPFKEFLPKILAHAAEALGCEGLSLMSYDPEENLLFFLCQHGLPIDISDFKIPFGKGLHGWVAQERKPLLIADITKEKAYIQHSFLDQFSRSLLIVPLATSERLIGTIGAYQKKGSSCFTEDDLRLLITIGRLLTTHFENHRLFQDSSRKLHYLATLYKVGSSASQTLNPQKLFSMILQHVHDVMNVENCSLMIFDPIKELLTLDAAIGMPKKLVGTVTVKLGEGISGWVAQNKRPLLIKDVTKDERFSQRSSNLDYKTRAALSAPIIHNETLLGVINVNNKLSAEAFTHDDLNLLIGISDQISQAMANANLYQKTEQQIVELSLIQELGKAINSSLDLDSVLNYFIDITTRLLEADKSTLMLLKEETKELYVQASRGFVDARVKGVTFKLGEGIAGMAASQKRPIRILNTNTDPKYKKLSLKELDVPLTLISAPLLNKDTLIGVINCERELSKKGPFTADNLSLLDTLASQATTAIDNARLYHNLLNVYLETIRALAAAIDAKDSYTHGHSRRVTDLSVGVAMVMGLNRNHIDTIRHAALLHDVGKIGISEQILLKPGRLTEEEFEAIKSHPLIGAGILNSIEFLKSVCLIIEHHHERFDGKGYPSGLSGEEIPLGARIIMIADSFDAITSSRPYRQPLSFEEALAEIKQCAGTQFDSKIVDQFLGLRESIYCPDWLKRGSL